MKPIGHISGITAVVEDPKQAAALFARSFDLPLDGTAVSMGGVRLAFRPRGARGTDTERTGVFALDLAAEDVAGARDQLHAVANCEKIGDLSAPGLAHGVRINVVAAASTSPAPRPSSVFLDHVGVASADNARAVELFCGRLGFPLESQQTDMEYRIPVESFVSDRYGVIHHTRQPEAVGGLRVAFVTVGEFELEFLQDIYATDGAAAAVGAGTTRGDQSAIARYVTTRGPGLHHLALRVTEIDGVLHRLAAEGLPLIDQRGRPGSRRARIAFVHPRWLGGLLIHLVERATA
jgi:methylmalonyl-CoA epimerase